MKTRIPGLLLTLTTFLAGSTTLLTRTSNTAYAQTPSGGLSSTTLGKIKSNLAEAAQQSWELGTRAQALLELDSPAYSVFHTEKSSIPPPSSSQLASGGGQELEEVLNIALNVVANRSRSNGDVEGAQPLMQDGSAADPASNGVAVLLANWTEFAGSLTDSGGGGDVDYEGAAKDQLDFLFDKVPKTDDGAISHRVSEVQLW